MAYDENSAGRAMREILAASSSFRKTLSQVKKEYPNLPTIDIRVTESTEEKSSSSSTSDSPEVVYLQTVELRDDDQAEVDLHGKQMEDQGCTCVDIADEPGNSKGEHGAECDCSSL